MSKRAGAPVHSKEYELPRNEVPAKLYEQARRRLLANAPLASDSRPEGLAVAALSVGELDALSSVGLQTQPWVAAAERDPLTRSIADYMALLETSYTTGEAAKYLRVDASRIRQRLRERSLYGVEYDGEKRLPRFQFERQRVVPGMREVIAALPPDLSPLDVAQWFLAPNPDLEMGERTLSPREWLLQGARIDTVAALARGM